MSETTSEDGPGGPDGGDPGDVLDTLLSASHDVYRRSLPPGLLAEIPDAGPPPGDDGPGPAAEEAAAGPAGPGRGAGPAAYALCDLTGIDAAFRLHTLARAINRAPELVPEIAPAIGLVVGEDGATPAPAEQEALTDRLAAFAAGRRDGEGLTHARWVEFVDALGGPAAVQATEASDDVVPLVDLPACNDEEVIDTPHGRAASVRSAFRTSRALSEVKQFVDPQEWARCGRPYWTEMSLRGDRSRFSRGTSSVWVAVFREEVDVPIVGPVAVNLRVRYREAENYAVADYRLAADPEPGDEVTFDSGWLYAVTDGEGGGTHVEGLKAIRFAEPIYNRLPDLACDGGWLHFMIGMALGCGDRPPMAGRLPDAGVMGVGEAGTGPASQDDVVTALGAIADEWVDAASRSMLAHRASMTSAMERALAPTPDPRWVNDLVGMGSGVISTAEATLEAWRRSMAELRKLGGA